MGPDHITPPGTWSHHPPWDLVTSPPHLGPGHITSSPPGTWSHHLLPPPWDLVTSPPPTWDLVTSPPTWDLVTSPPPTWDLVTLPPPPLGTGHITPSPTWDLVTSPLPHLGPGHITSSPPGPGHITSSHPPGTWSHHLPPHRDYPQAGGMHPTGMHSCLFYLFGINHFWKRLTL